MAFDCSDDKTREHIKDFIDLAHQVGSENVRIVLVGCKRDLVEYVIDYKELETAYPECPVFITSSCTGEGIDQLKLYLFSIARSLPDNECSYIPNFDVNPESNVSNKKGCC